MEISCLCTSLLFEHKIRYKFLSTKTLSLSICNNNLVLLASMWINACHSILLSQHGKINSVRFLFLLNVVVVHNLKNVFALCFLSFCSELIELCANALMLLRAGRFIIRLMCNAPNSTHTWQLFDEIPIRVDVLNKLSNWKQGLVRDQTSNRS